jgi:hypothetical protein
VANFFSTVLPYQKNADIMRCPSDPKPVDLWAGFRNLRLPPICTTSPPSRYLSYQFNYAVVEQGYPNCPVRRHGRRPPAHGQDMGRHRVSHRNRPHV